MAKCSDDQLHLQNADPNIEPELRALMGMFALNSFLNTQMEEKEDCDGVGALGFLERSLLVRLDRPKRLGELARDTNSLPSTMTAAADQMERFGLVVRQRDPIDRRAWRLHLTEKGQESRAEIVQMSRVLLQEVLGLSDDELSSFAAIGTKIHANIQLALNNPEHIKELRKQA